MKQKTLSKTVFLIVYISVAVGCILLDQLTKLWIFDGLLDGNGSVNVLGTFLRFQTVYNRGAAFGMGQSEAANYLFFVVTIIGVPLFGYLLWRSRIRSVWGQIGFAFIIGGTIGNFIDRAFVHNTSGKFFDGAVRDFISFSIFPPVFNVADSFLVIGVVFALLAIVFFDFDGLVPAIREENAQRQAATQEQEISNPTPEAHADNAAADDVTSAQDGIAVDDNEKN